MLVPGVLSASASLTMAEARVVFDSSTTSPEAILEASDDAGFPAAVLELKPTDVEVAGFGAGGRGGDRALERASSTLVRRGGGLASAATAGARHARFPAASVEVAVFGVRGEAALRDAEAAMLALPIVERVQRLDKRVEEDEGDLFDAAGKQKKHDGGGRSASQGGMEALDGSRQQGWESGNRCGESDERRVRCSSGCIFRQRLDGRLCGSFPASERRSVRARPLPEKRRRRLVRGSRRGRRARASRHRLQRVFRRSG